MKGLLTEVRLENVEELGTLLNELCGGGISNEPWYLQRRGEFLFRGQGNSKHQIKSTLERTGLSTLFCADYYISRVHRARVALESAVGKNFSVPSNKALINHFSEYEIFLSGDSKLPAYELLALLRHHGFPSPLIDWSFSPYVALYFACSQDRELDGALWIYNACQGAFNLTCCGLPQIVRMGHYIATHERHQRQQSDYLIAVRYPSSDSESNQKYWSFVPFQSVYEQQEKWAKGKIDLMKKVTIPKELKLPLLKHLDAMNINAYTLMNTLDALMETESFRLGLR